MVNIFNILLVIIIYHLYQLFEEASHESFIAEAKAEHYKREEDRNKAAKIEANTITPVTEEKGTYTSRNYDIVETNCDYFGNNGQEGIAMLNVGDQVMLQPIPDNAHDNTGIAVFTVGNYYCGWLPKQEYIGTLTSFESTGKSELFNTLMKSIPVKAVVKNKYQHIDRTYGLTISCRFITYEQQKEPQAQNISNSNTYQYQTSSPKTYTTVGQPLTKENYGLPEKLETGEELYILREYLVVGTRYEHFGNNGQKGILSVNVGDTVYLRPDPNNAYDNTAVAVFNSYNEYCGWLPAGNDHSSSNGLEYTGTSWLFKRLMKGVPTKAVVIDKFLRNEDNTYGIRIACASYKKPSNRKTSEPSQETINFGMECFQMVKDLLIQNNLDI
ncbi:MAG: HIRAN domain-containing protein, partial [Eubacterium sp.]|nr:HIRAN domain-containing protein [Eubacterium sp.]